MERLRGFPRRFRFAWRSAARVRRDVEDELAFHLAEKTEALQREGLSVKDARAEALRDFGDLEAAREQLVADDRRGEKQSRRLTMLEDLVRDTRLAWRSLWRTPTVMVVAVLVLAVGVGATTAMYSLFHQILVQRLPARDAVGPGAAEGNPVRRARRALCFEKYRPYHSGNARGPAA